MSKFTGKVKVPKKYDSPYGEITPNISMPKKSARDMARHKAKKK